jgi:hypothetical protein
MRRRLSIAAIAVVVLVGGGLILATRADDGAESGAANDTGLEAQTVSAGEIDIEIEPRQLDDQGAAFELVLDTHSVELDVDLTDATLEVAGTAWRVAGWDGDDPSGHHREGELRFEPGGPATGTARLVLAGFAEPVEVTWDLGA